MRIALLEDHVPTLTYLVDALESRGHLVFPFTHAVGLLASLPLRDADELEEMEDEEVALPYDVILMDIWLHQEKPGTEVASMIQQQIPQHRLPIIFISAVDMGEVRDVQAAYPHIPLLRKPFHLKELISTIESQLATKELYPVCKQDNQNS